ncbi:MAG: RES domain-containing protein [Thermomicrobiales bacterium]|nr:RES domain-containing protein [Thermomicrobiales bacterium]
MVAVDSLRPWNGRVYRHLPEGTPYGPLDRRFAARPNENRWAAAGFPTFTFASSPDLARASFIQHLHKRRANALQEYIAPRQLFAIDLDLVRVFDLRDPVAAEQLGIRGAPNAFRVHAVASATGGFLRHALGAEAILVPELSAPKDPHQWHLILFLDQVRRPFDDVVTGIERLETFRCPTAV